MKPAALLAAAVAVGGCEHAWPYEPGPPTPPPPASGPFPRRLTFNPESEWNPVFTPDAASILYSFAVPGRADRDRCLAFGPAGGGWMTQQLCWRGGDEVDSTDVVVVGARSAGGRGRLAFVAERGGVQALAPLWRALLVGPADDPGRSVPVMTFPRLAPSGVQWHGATDLVWIGDSMLVFLAQAYAYAAGNAIVPPYTFTTGVEIVRLDLRSTPPEVRVYDGTRHASSVAAGTTPATVVHTMGGDARVWTLDLETGARAVLRDLAPLGIVRDARVTGQTLVFIAGGKVGYGPSPAFGIDQQADSGGYVYAVDLAGAAPPTRITPDPYRFYRRLSVATVTGRVAAEGYPVSIVHAPCDCFAFDTLVSLQADVYLIQIP